MKKRNLERRALPILLMACVFMLSGAQAQSPNAGQLFQRLDKNGDGRLSAEEVRQKQLFERLDADNDGFVSPDEAKGFQGTRTAQASNKPGHAAVEIACGKHDLQKLDLYTPEKAKDAPVMIYVHGGGWRKGDKGAVGLKAEYFNGLGWIFVSVNYRLVPDGKHPNNVEDVAAAIAWVHGNIAKRGGNPEKIFIMGHSAGAHLVALVATDERPLKKAGQSLSVIKGVIPLDTNAYDAQKQVDESPSDLYANVFGTDEAMQRDASPIYHIAKDKGIPPFLIFYSSGLGNQPNPNRPLAANAFAGALKKAGIPAEVVDASDRNHGQINQRFGELGDDMVTGKAIAFLNRILGETTPKHAKMPNRPPQ
jgi:arylformamidase